MGYYFFITFVNSTLQLYELALEIYNHKPYFCICYIISLVTQETLFYLKMAAIKITAWGSSNIFAHLHLL